MPCDRTYDGRSMKAQFRAADRSGARLAVVVGPEELSTGKVKVQGKTRTVGFASAVGRKGAKRTVRVTFVSEDGVRSTATTTYPK